MNSAAPVSVVVPCYRCAATIGRALASVAGQSQRPAEVILVDDASGDETLQQLHSLQAQHGQWIKVVALTTNAGAASARNVGWNLATQPYIAFLDSDDAWHPQKIAIQYDYMQQHPDVALSGHLCRQLPADMQAAPDWFVDWTGVGQVITWSQLLLRHQFVTPSVMLQREMSARFVDGARHMEDYRLWLDIAAVPLRMVKLQAELAAVYKPVYGASGLSADMWRMEQAELANYRHFHRAGNLSLVQLFLLQGYSLAKFVRRMLIARFRGNT
jgi:glycosyltransferase involved in cell wall biosynthesis